MTLALISRVEELDVTIDRMLEDVLIEIPREDSEVVAGEFDAGPGTLVFAFTQCSCTSDDETVVEVNAAEGVSCKVCCVIVFALAVSIWVV